MDSDTLLQRDRSTSSDSTSVFRKLTELREKGNIAEQSKNLFVDDGSKDKTWDIIKELSKSDPAYKGIRQSRNRGHQNAVLVGLMESKNQ